MGRSRKFPGETKEERAAWRVAWARYLDAVEYPKELRISGNPDFEGLRKLFIRTRQNELAKYADDINHVNARVKDLLPLAGNGKIQTPQQQHQQVLAHAAKTNFKNTAAKKGTKQVKPPPTGYHSPLPVRKWLIHYLPQLYRGKDAKYLSRKLKKGQSIFEVLINAPTITHTTTRKVKKPRLYFIQRKMLKFLSLNPWAAFEVFRSAGKTQLALGLMVYIICENPNLRLFLLSEEFKKTVSRVRLIRKMLCSPKVVADYGYLIDESGHGKNTEYAFQCFRDIDAIEPTLMAITWKDAQALGFHFDGGILDDPWSEKLQNETEAKEKWLAWWGEFRFCLEDAKFCWMLRTKKAVHDLYEDLDAMSLWAVFKQLQVLKFPSKIEYLENKQGVIDDVNFSQDFMIYDNCFGKYSMKNLLLLQHENPFFFEREIQNHPYQIEGDVFKWTNANLYDATSADPFVKDFFKQVAFGDSVRFIKIMDMAFGLSETADYNVLVVMAKWKNRYFIFDAWVGRWDFDARLQAIKSAEVKYPGVPLHIESDFSQLTTIKDIRKRLPSLKIREFQSKGKGLDYKALYDGQKKAGKKGKIHDALEVPWADGRVYIRKDLPRIDLLQEQITQFPKCTYFDYIDTVAMGFHVLHPKSSGVTAIFC